MRTTVDLDASLLKRLRDEAHRRGVSFKEALSGAVRRGLAEPTAARQAKYRCPTFDMGAPVEGVNLDKALQVASALEDEETVRELARRK
jgi:hypothetical protein